MTGHHATTMYGMWLLGNENAFTGPDFDTSYSYIRNFLQSLQKQRTVMLTSYRLMMFIHVCGINWQRSYSVKEAEQRVSICLLRN